MKNSFQSFNAKLNNKACY